MCVRDRDSPSTKTGGDRHRQPQASTSKNDDDIPKQRRNSCLTEEGFEIALPPPSPTSAKRTTAAATSPKRTRRRSIFDEDGNEIVLSPPPVVGASSTSSAVVEEDVEDADNVDDKNEGGLRNANKKTAKFVSRGGSSIVSPFGEVLAGPQWEDDEGIIYADVNMDDCVRGRLDLDTAGSYSR